MNSYLKVLFVLILGVLSFKLTKAQDSTSSTPDTTFYTVVEKMPEFPGGFDSLRAYLKRERKHPKEDSLNGIEGAVLIEFVIEKNGSVSSVKSVKDPKYVFTKAMEQEAIRLVTAMPNWQPAMQLGKPVRMKFQMPIRFLLD